MSFAFSPRRARLGLGAVALMALASLSGSDIAAAGEPKWPSQVSAVYGVTFNGFDIGTFAFKAEVSSGRYTLSGDAQISALLGFVKWQGITRTSGAVSWATATPAVYAFDYSSSKTSGSVRMAFRNGTVASIAANPPLPASPEMVPLERAHLKGVLDPLSAVLALSRPSGSDPCDQRLPIYDGLQRFDLVMTSKGVRNLTGDHGVLHVCEMRYRPISGYRRGKETEDLARTMKIEISFRPVPSAGLFVPHEIRIPTLVGSAVLALQKIDILTSDHDQVAFAE